MRAAGILRVAPERSHDRYLDSPRDELPCDDAGGTAEAAEGPPPEYLKAYKTYSHLTVYSQPVADGLANKASRRRNGVVVPARHPLMNPISRARREGGTP